MIIHSNLGVQGIIWINRAEVNDPQKSKAIRKVIHAKPQARVVL